jgi:Leucine-rich repeat (LRR) protein
VLHLRLHSSQNPKALRLGVGKENLYLRILDIRLPTVGYANDILLEKAGTKDCQKADRQLKTLTNLDLKGSQISDVKPLAGLTKLNTFSLSGNQISDVKPLAGLANLTEIWLDGNQITDIKPLAGLTKLVYLGLLDNPISVKVCPLKPASICEFDAQSNIPKSNP